MNPDRRFGEFIKYLVPVIQKQFERSKGTALTDGDFDDICADISIKVLGTVRNKNEYANPYHLYAYMKGTIHHVVASKLGKYTNTLKNVPLDFDVYNDFSTRSTYDGMHVKDSIDLLVLNFRRIVKFKDKSTYNLCLILFDKNLKNEVIDKEFYRLKYRVNIDYMISYVSVVTRRILHELKIRDSINSYS